MLPCVLPLFSLKETFMPFIAICTFYIAIKQYQINKSQLKNNTNQLRFSLYDRRYKIFSETKNLLFKMCRDSNVSILVLNDFEFATRESIFLFNEDINVYLQQISNNVIDKQQIDKQYNEDKEKHKVEYDRLRHWFLDEKKDIENRFNNYLNLKNVAN